MPSSVARAVDTYVAGFSSRSIPVQLDLPATREVKVSRLGVPYATYAVHTARPAQQRFGRVARKTKALSVRSLVTPDTLLTAIKTRYAYLLQPSADGSHYVLDLSTLGEIQMRKRYRSLGCILHVTSDLSSVVVHPSDVTVPPDHLLTLASVALAVYTLLKESVVKLWSALAPTLTTAVGVASSISGLTTTQRSLIPFQSGLGAFLDKIDTFLVGARGVLFHLTGMKYTSLLAWLKNQVSALRHVLPTHYDATLSQLPLLQLGTEYYKHFTTYVEDALKKSQLVLSELETLTATAFLPNAWTPVQKLAYLLWSLTFYHTLTVDAVQTTFETIGSVLTHAGASLFQGIQTVLAAFRALFSFKGTSLVAASEVLTSPALARKFISLNELLHTDATYAGEAWAALAPTRVFLVPT